MKSRKWKVVCIRLIFLQLETTRLGYLSSHSLEHRRWFFLSFSLMLRWCCKPCQRLRHKLFEEREALNVLSVGKGRITLQTVGCSLYLPKMHFPSSSPSCFSLDFFCRFLLFLGRLYWCCHWEILLLNWFPAQFDPQSTDNENMNIYLIWFDLMINELTSASITNWCCCKVASIEVV